MYTKYEYKGNISVTILCSQNGRQKATFVCLQPKVRVVKKCHLCASHSPLNVYSEPSAWPEETQQWLNNLCSKIIPPEAPVCRACEKFIKHYTSKDNIIPRWLPKGARSKARSYCRVEGCRDVSHTTSSITYEAAREHLDLIEASQDDPTISPLTLCNSHYQHLYKEVHFPQPCAACSSQPRYGGDYTHHCPDPEKNNILKADIRF